MHVSSTATHRRCEPPDPLARNTGVRSKEKLAFEMYTDLLVSHVETILLHVFYHLFHHDLTHMVLYLKHVVCLSCDTFVT